jgi:hypothetical protein
MVHFVRHDLCSCGSPKSPLRLGIMSQYLPDIFQTFMLIIWHTQKVPYACALGCANMAQIACKIGYFVSGQKCQLWHRQRTPSTQFFWTKICIHHIGTYLKGFGYSELTLGPFEKMTFFPPDPLIKPVYNPSFKDCERHRWGAGDNNQILSKQLLSSCNCLLVGTVLKPINLSYCCYQC